MSVRFPKALLKDITAQAKKNGRSRNSEIVVVLSRYIAGTKAEPVDPESSR